MCKKGKQNSSFILSDLSVFLKFITDADSCLSEEANHFDHKVLEWNSLPYFIEDRPVKLKKQLFFIYLLFYLAMNLIIKLQVEEAFEKPGLYMIGSLW